MNQDLGERYQEYERKSTTTNNTSYKAILLPKLIKKIGLLLNEIMAFGEDYRLQTQLISLKNTFFGK
ncbi:hypothetical protein [Chryseobacterium scophthalmum]|uniref:hypothetical protein n=1 Tax=Chryseobacterium scophthalmum TaxID=59733 RepID=UPI000940FB6E|nr:hypothetical protein [Chryseobacterium scophthalmum]